MSSKRAAVVLHQYVSGHLALLDQQEGRLDVRPRASRKRYEQLFRGAHISYMPVMQQGAVHAYDIDILDMPFALAQEDILFFHHVLELVYTFFPVGAWCTDIFALMNILYRGSELLKTSPAKSFFLLRLFDLLGFHPERQKFQGAAFHALVAIPIDMLLQEGIDLQAHEYIHAWLNDCIKSHPMIHSLKTVHFLETVRT
ncbi:MAG: hypothetical protein WD068_02290 [Candidatus Babeliales bacterium]